MCSDRVEEPTRKWGVGYKTMEKSFAENDLAEEGAPSDEALTSVADWWAKWVMKAGHKRLGRILLQYKTEVKQ